MAPGFRRGGDELNIKQGETMTEPRPITVAYGDGIGPEIMEATLNILKEAGAQLKIDTIEVGEKVYKMGNSTGIPQAAWESLRRNKVLLKSPITTPQGGGYKSLNVTMRKTLGLYANVRPCYSYHPFVKTHHPRMDMVIVRENEEDLYAGIEYHQTPDSFQSIKLITRSGSERIIRYAFEYAIQNNRRKVTCMSKDNIMKITDGLFHKLFDEIGKEYPDIEKDHYIIDIGAARIANSPWRFDVIVTENLYGDIISDIAAEVSGSVGLAGSSNIGPDFAMFEAIHGSAPDISGQNIANPSGLLRGAIMMLIHIGQHEVATKIENAWLRTIEDGIHTADIYGTHSKEKVGTQEFAKAVIARFGQKPEKLPAANYQAKAVAATSSKHTDASKASREKHHAQKRELVGVDVFLYSTDSDVEKLGRKIASFNAGPMKLGVISSKGLKVYPDFVPGMSVSDQLRCRFQAEAGKILNNADILALLKQFQESGIEFIEIANLYHFDGVAGYSLGQGE